MPEKSQNNIEPVPKEVEFHYLKSTHFRTIHADGAIGSVTPSRHIHMAIYSERQPIPKEIVQEVMANGKLGNIIQEKTISLEGIVREMEIDVLMNVATAKSLVVWLQDKIQQVEQINKELNSTGGE